MTVIDIVAADLRERILLVIQFYLHSAGQRAEAEPVGADISAGLFNKLYKAAVIDLGADYRYPRAVFPILRLARFYLLKRLLKLVDYEILRHNICSKGQNMELIACYPRACFLSEVSYLGYNAADAVMLLNGLAYSSIRDIDAVIFAQRLEYVVFALQNQQLNAIFIGLERYLHKLVEEFIVPLAHGF